ncbi:Peroxidasin [Drechslerella dactyloides]|uniref:Peroxidasin n=1 Tax=Drechslerella dactyloides TaxID=74499 RepID=A0AAD6IVE1_DREDA|nr:Peroxidasin [Drechslerella dactyloides]
MLRVLCNEASQTATMEQKNNTVVNPTFKPSFFENVGIKLFRLVNGLVPWHKLPGFLGAINLGVLRVELRAYNLHDGYSTAAPQGTVSSDPVEDERYLGARNSDGKFNSLQLPRMGCTGMRFGRNFPRQYTPRPTDEELWTPNPRMLSERFMKRKEDGGFIPATTLNLLAAAWIQFQTHDWFNHERKGNYPARGFALCNIVQMLTQHNGQSDADFDIPLPPGDTWPHGKMLLHHTKPDATLDDSDIACPGYRNTNTSWWDGSQIYGSEESVTNTLRAKHPDGKLELTPDESGRPIFLPRDVDGNVRTGFADNWWVGMEMLHTLFALEHNALCDMFRKAYPGWTGDQIFDKARLVNCALMAKIHTVEWTPAILAHPALQIAMSANWWGLVGEKLTKLLGRISKSSETISGIPGSGVDQYGVPFSLTEEFVSVYRMHSLIPDNIAFFGVGEGGRHVSTVPVDQTLLANSRQLFLKSGGGLSFTDAFYSFGINYPGAITNFNYPNFLRNLSTPDGQVKDMGTVDILRDRERGVPRYCQFRRLLRLPVPKSFEELTGGNKALAKDLSDAYNGDIELVDALVGSHSEPLPKGFGFSETAFRVFILMASRRLKSDRFIAGQWNEETYTREGFRWVQNTGMKDVLGRHFPELNSVLSKSKNVFAPWNMLGESKKYDGVETTVPKK